MDGELTAELNRIRDENERQNHRINSLEEALKEVQNLTLSVQSLANSMEGMMKEQAKQGERLCQLEKEPADRWNNMTRTVFNTLIGALIGGLVAYLFR